MSEKKYRPCVGIMLINPQGLVFVGRRRNKNLREHVAPGHEWQMPQGGIDEGEDVYQAALRELAEETNVTSTQLLAEAGEWFAYDLPEDIAREAWKGRYCGQTQKWFALRFTGSDSEIDIEHPAGGHKPEFDAWQWVPMADLPDLIIPFKRPVYERVTKEFARFSAPEAR
ncbi:MAG: pyrophosphohydrolase [Pseudomonadota bacterium]|jgi:putative (di)nucleoside polyphosphate hydrolase